MSLLGKQDLNILVDEVKQDINRKVNAIKGDLFAPSENTKLTTVNGVKEFTCEESGYVDNVYLEGETLVNLVDLKSNAGFNGDGTFKLENNGVTLSCASGAESTYAFRQYNLQNKEYTFICEIDFSCESIEVVIVDPVVQNIQYVVDKNIKMIRTKFTPPTSSSTLLRVDCNGIGEAKFRNIMILEGDYTNKEVNYIEGLKSVGQGDKIEVLSYKCDNNLIPPNTTYTDNMYLNYETGVETPLGTHRYINEYIEVEPNTMYLLRGCSLHFCLYDSNKNIIKTHMPTPISDLDGDMLSYKITTPDTKYVRVSYWKKYSNQLGIYKKGKYDKKQILCTLRSLPSGTKDKVYKNGNDYVKHEKCLEVQVLPNNVYMNVNNTNTFNVATDFILNNVDAFYLSKTDNWCYCNVLPAKTHGDYWNSDVACIHMKPDGKIYINIPKSQMSTQDINGAIKWINDYKPTIVYPLKNSNLIELPNFNPRTFADKTTFLCNSGIVQAEVDFEVTNNLRSEVDVLKDKVDSAFQFGSSTKKNLADKLTSVGVPNMSASNTFDELIANIPSGCKVVTGVAVVTEGKSYPFNTIDAGMYTKSHVNVNLDFKPDILVVMPKTNTGSFSILHNTPYIHQTDATWAKGNPYIICGNGSAVSQLTTSLLFVKADNLVFLDNNVVRMPVNSGVTGSEFYYTAIKYK